MPLSPAHQWQLIRAGQKDEYYQTFLRNNANETFQTLAGEFIPNGNTRPGSFVLRYLLETRVLYIVTLHVYRLD